ncbi:MAG: HAD-IB family phosphatase [Desulfurococcaceae archaeon]
MKYRGLVVLDCDGVLVLEKSSWGLLHRAFGSEPPRLFGELYRRGIISYHDWMKIDVALMIYARGGPITREEVESAARAARLREGAREFVERARACGLRVAVVSSGVDAVVRMACEAAGVDECHYNELAYVDGVLVPGGRPNVPPLEKPKIIERLARDLSLDMDMVAYVGDDAWDAHAFSSVGLPVAMEPCGDACGLAKAVARDFEELWMIVSEYFGC